MLLQLPFPLPRLLLLPVQPLPGHRVTAVAAVAVLFTPVGAGTGLRSILARFEDLQPRT
jgi:hypothetical protein